MLISAHAATAVASEGANLDEVYSSWVLRKALCEFFLDVGVRGEKLFGDRMILGVQAGTSLVQPT